MYSERDLKKWIGLALVGLALAGCASEQPGDAGRYHNKDLGFSIRFHAGWEVGEGDGIEYALVEGVSPWEDDLDEFAEHVSVDVEEIYRRIDIDTYFAETLEGQMEVMPEFRAEEQGQTTIDGIDARWVVFEFESEGYPMTALAYAVLKEKRAYLISGIAQAEKFVLYRSVFEQTAESLRFD